jgi:hypothetical protein
MIVDNHSSLQNSTHDQEFSYNKFIARDLIHQYSFLLYYNWTCVYNSISVDVAVYSLNNAVHEAMGLVIHVDSKTNKTKQKKKKKTNSLHGFLHL